MSSNWLEWRGGEKRNAEREKRRPIDAQKSSMTRGTDRYQEKGEDTRDPTRNRRETNIKIKAPQKKGEKKNRDSDDDRLFVGGWKLPRATKRSPSRKRNREKEKRGRTDLKEPWGEKSNVGR